MPNCCCCCCCCRCRCRCRCRGGGGGGGGGAIFLLPSLSTGGLWAWGRLEKTPRDESRCGWRTGFTESQRRKTRLDAVQWKNRSFWMMCYICFYVGLCDVVYGNGKGKDEVWHDETWISNPDVTYRQFQLRFRKVCASFSMFQWFQFSTKEDRKFSKSAYTTLGGVFLGDDCWCDIYGWSTYPPSMLVSLTFGLIKPLYNISEGGFLLGGRKSSPSHETWKYSQDFARILSQT